MIERVNCTSTYTNLKKKRYEYWLAVPPDFGAAKVLVSTIPFFKTRPFPNAQYFAWLDACESRVRRTLESLLPLPSETRVTAPAQVLHTLQS